MKPNYPIVVLVEGRDFEWERGPGGIGLRGDIRSMQLTQAGAERLGVFGPKPVGLNLSVTEYEGPNGGRSSTVQITVDPDRL